MNVRIKTVLVGFAASTMMTMASAHPALATVSDKPLDIIPLCSIADQNISKWEVRNENDQNLGINWNNVENNATGEYLATAASTTEMETDYNPSDPNNRTEFSVNGFSTVSRNAQVAECAPEEELPAETCVDGSKHDNLNAYVLGNSASVMTRDGALLCEDVVLYFSSYIMPRDYNGQPFENNPTASPQTIFSSLRIVLEKGTTGEHIVSIGLPDSCENIQVDLYYAPEITTVGPNGHGTQNLVGKIYPSTGPCVTDVDGETETPEVPEVPVVPVPVVTPTPVTPAPTTPTVGQTLGTTFAPTAVLPQTLPATGSVTQTNPLIAIALGVMTYITMLGVTRRIQL